MNVPLAKIIPGQQVVLHDVAELVVRTEERDGGVSLTLHDGRITVALPGSTEVFVQGAQLLITG